MTTAEKIAKLKDAEKQAYDRYVNALMHEVNAMLKRLGMNEKTYDDVLMAYQFEIDNCDEGKNTFNKLSIPMLTAIVRYAKELPYVEKLCTKWNSLFRELQQVKEALK